VRRRSGCLVGLLVVVVLAVIVAIAGHSGTSGSTPQGSPAASSAGSPSAGAAPSAPTAPPTPAFAPQTLLTLSGSGTEDTASFTVPAGSGDWKIIWTYNEGSFGQSVNFEVSSEDFQADVNKLGTGGSGTEYVYGDPGTHHLSVISEGAWTLRVVTVP
jgi:hypothetical protein